MPNREQAEDITALLRAASPDVLDRLYSAVEGELRRLARSLRAGRPEDPVLQTTALVDEAFMRLVANSGTVWEDSSAFFRVAHGTMRNILADHGRRRRPHQFHEGAAPAIPAPRTPEPARGAEEGELLAGFADALRELERDDADAASALLLCFFGTVEAEVALTEEELRSFSGERRPLHELAAERGTSVTTTHRTLARALAFLQSRLGEHR